MRLHNTNIFPNLCCFSSCPERVSNLLGLGFNPAAFIVSITRTVRSDSFVSLQERRTAEKVACLGRIFRARY
eukprot:UN00241